MNFLIRLFCLSIVLLISFTCFRCHLGTVNITGGWELISSSNCDVNFLNLKPIIYPFRLYGQKIYLENNRLINFNNKDSIQFFLPFDKPYKLTKSGIKIDGMGIIEFQIIDSVLLLKKNNCELFFKRESEVEELLSIKIESVSMATINSDSILVDSIEISKDDFSLCKDNMTSPNCRYLSYVFMLIGKIKTKQLNKQYDFGASDTNQYRIYFRNNTNDIFTIISNGKNETPIEVLNLISYLQVHSVVSSM